MNYFNQAAPVLTWTHLFLKDTALHILRSRMEAFLILPEDLKVRDYLKSFIYIFLFIQSFPDFLKPPWEKFSNDNFTLAPSIGNTKKHIVAELGSVPQFP